MILMERHHRHSHRQQGLPDQGGGDDTTTSKNKADYYNSGSSELATETKLTLSRLEPVRTVRVVGSVRLIGTNGGGHGRKIL